MNITHASRPFIIDGVEYQFSPITLEDLEYLDTWIRSRALEAGRMTLSDDLSAEEERRAMLPIAEAANKLSLFGGNSTSQLFSPLGAARLMMRMLRKHSPDVTAAVCFSWMLRPEIRDAVMPVMVDMFKTAIGANDKPGKNGEARSEDESRPMDLTPSASSSGDSSASESNLARSAS